MAVSRFDRRPPERDSTRINERIRVPEVRLIDENGEQVGIVPTPDALERARERDLDLVEVAPNSKPPVTRILDYSKYKYEQEQKAKAARKHQHQVNVREIKLRPKIAQHDYETKRGHVERFLKQQDKVKVTIMFRGREQSQSRAWADAPRPASPGRFGDRRDGAGAPAGGSQHDHAARPHAALPDKRTKQRPADGPPRRMSDLDELRRRRALTEDAARPEAAERRHATGRQDGQGEHRRTSSIPAPSSSTAATRSLRSAGAATSRT